MASWFAKATLEQAQGDHPQVFPGITGPLPGQAPVYEPAKLSTMKSRYRESYLYLRSLLSFDKATINRYKPLAVAKDPDFQTKWDGMENPKNRVNFMLETMCHGITDSAQRAIWIEEQHRKDHPEA